MNRSLRFVSSLCVLAALVVAPTARGQKQEDTSVAAFLVLKRDVEELRQDAERKKFRHNYDKLVARLQALAQAHKDGTRADDAVFVAAQLLEELYYCLLYTSRCV